MHCALIALCGDPATVLMLPINSKKLLCDNWRFNEDKTFCLTHDFSMHKGAWRVTAMTDLLEFSSRKSAFCRDLSLKGWSSCICTEVWSSLFVQMHEQKVWFLVHQHDSYSLSSLFSCAIKNNLIEEDVLIVTYAHNIEINADPNKLCDFIAGFLLWLPAHLSGGRVQLHSDAHECVFYCEETS